MKKILLRKKVKQVCLLFAITLCSTISYAQDTIKTSGLTFVPDSLTIMAGDTVCFLGIGAFHPLFFENDTTISYTVDSTCFVGGSSILPVGTNNYYCNNHGAFGGIGMAGKIIVQDTTTGIKNVKTANFQLTISPNPFYEYTTLKIKSSGQKINSFKVYNVIGKEIVSYDLSNKSNTLSYKINFSGLEPGVYFCSIYTEMGLIETKKLVLLK